MSLPASSLFASSRVSCGSKPLRVRYSTRTQARATRLQASSGDIPYAPRLRERGYSVTIHADALNLKQHAALLPGAGVNVIEAFTPPPVGNLPVGEVRSAWGPEVTLHINVPETLFHSGYDATFVAWISNQTRCCSLQLFAQLKFSGRLQVKSPRIRAPHVRKSLGQKSPACATG